MRQSVSVVPMVLLMCIMLAGCGTKGKEVKTALEIHDNENCVISIYPDISTESGDSKTDSANKATFEDLVRLPPVEDIMETAIKKGVDTSLLEGILPKPDEPTTPVVEPDQPVIEPDPITDIINGTGKNTRIGLQAGKEGTGGKSYNWLPKNGAKYTSPLIVSFPQCNASMVIKDPSNAYGTDGNTNNHNQMFYFGGSPEKQRDTNMSCEGGCASIFAPPGCPATYAILNQ